MAIYASLQDIRDEGVSTTVASDARVNRMLEVASRYLDIETGRIFSPEVRTFDLDGSGTSVLALGLPIITLTTLYVTEHGIFDDAVAEDLTKYKVFNRHLSQGLFDPDDRNFPRIAYASPATLDIFVGRYSGVFPKGRQNVRVVGRFGYTDPDGTAYGKTPELIREATILVTIQSLTRKADLAGSMAAANAGAIKMMRTRDQSVEYAVQKMPTKLSVSRAVLDIITQYRRPRRLEVVG